MGTIKDYRNMVEQPWGKMFYEMIYKQLNIPKEKKIRIIDFGGTSIYWQSVPFKYLSCCRISLVNPEKNDEVDEIFTSIVGDVTGGTHESIQYNSHMYSVKALYG